MSKLENFVQSMKTRASKRMSKKLLMSDMTTSIAMARDAVLPVTELASGKSAPTFKTSWTQVRNERYLRALKIRDKNMFFMVNTLVQRAIVILEDLKDYMEKSDEVVIEGLTYKTASALQLYYTTRWFLDYSKDFLLMVYSNESDLELGDSRAVPPFTKAQIAEIENKYDLYIQLSVFFHQNYKTSVGNYLEALPDIDVKEADSSALESLMSGESSFRIPETPATKNFMMGASLFIASIIAQSQEAKYRRAQAEQETVKLRILQTEILKREAEGNEGKSLDGRELDSIEKQLEYNHKRLRDISSEVRRLEEKYEL